MSETPDDTPDDTPSDTPAAGQPVPVQLLASPWRAELLAAVAATRSSLLLVSPFIKDRLIAAVEDALVTSQPSGVRTPLQARVLTRVRLDDALAGASDLTALERLFGWQDRLAPCTVELRALDNVHAKVWVIDQRLAIIGSGNATMSGVETNVEYGVAISNPSLVARVLADWSEPWEAGEPITADVLASLRQLVARAATDVALRRAEKALAHRHQLLVAEAGLPTRIGRRWSRAVPSSGRRNVLGVQEAPTPYIFHIGAPPNPPIEAPVEEHLATPAGFVLMVNELRQALRWVLPVPLLDGAPVQLPPSAALKCVWDVGARTFSAIWADGSRTSIATVSPTPHAPMVATGNHSWACTLDAAAIHLLEETLNHANQLSNAAHIIVQRAEDGAALEVNVSTGAGMNTGEWRQIPCAPSVLPRDTPGRPSASVNLFVDASGFAQATAEVAQAIIVAHNAFPNVLHLRFGADPQQGSHLMLNVAGGPLDNAIERTLRVDGDQSAMRIPSGAFAYQDLHQVCASMNTAQIDRWQVSSPDGFEELSFQPLISSPDGCSTAPWRHTLRIAKY